jgi:transcription elongation GreA/GreB family factor
MKKRRGILPVRQMSEIAVTEADAERLTRLLQAQCARSFMPRSFPALQRKLDEAEWIDSRLIPPDVVTMNSRVRLRNLESGEEVIQTLVFPHGANPAQGCVDLDLSRDRDARPPSWRFHGVRGIRRSEAIPR